MNIRHKTRYEIFFAVILIPTLLSAIFVSSGWGVYAAPVLALKSAERAERSGKYVQAAAEREFTADFYKFVSIPQFADDMEYFQKTGEEEKA